MYIEGGDFGYSNSTNELYPYFGCTFVSDGYDYLTGNVQTMTGQSGTFGQGLDLGYMYQQPPDAYVDQIEANGGTVLYRDQSGIGRAVCYAGPTNSYRAVHMATTFGALRTSDVQRDLLATALVDYLLELSGIGSGPGREPRALALTVTPNPAVLQVKFRYRSAKPGRLEVFDAAGKSVAAWNTAPSAGFGLVHWNGTDRSSRRLAPGCYSARFATSEGTILQRLVVAK